MHYYQFHIGDYKSHTTHLDLLEDLAYRRLLDIYYLHERPLNTGVASVARQIGMREHEDKVQLILEEFFKLTEAGWIHGRADVEIAKYQEFIAAGKRGAAKRWGKVEHKPDHTEANGEGNSPPNATPIVTNNHKPITNVKQTRGTRLPANWKPSAEQIAFCKQERSDIDPKSAADGFRDYWIAQAGTKGVKLDWDACWRNWVRNQRAMPKAAPKPSNGSPDWVISR